jgi:trehalose 6-phosphate synthase
LRRRLGLRNERIVVSVDRVDYTKGIPEKIAAVDRLLTQYPEMRGTFSLVQIGAPSRVHIPAYRRLQDEIDNLVEEVNWRHGQGIWRPVVFVNEHLPPEDIFPLYRIAAACVVGSVHDGMNLVAKEFVAARTDRHGALVLSHFTGAARELTDALLVNPYDVDGFAESLRKALTMPEDEQEARMERMRRQIEDNNIYRWAGMLLSEGSKLVGSRQLVGESL